MSNRRQKNILSNRYLNNIRTKIKNQLLEQRIMYKNILYLKMINKINQCATQELIDF